MIYRSSLLLALCGTGAAALSAQTYTQLFSFGSTDGAGPNTALVQGRDGKLYGTTYNGGSGSCSGGCGTIYGISTSGTETVLHNFKYFEGVYPNSLIQSGNGFFYGTNESTLFRVAPSGALVTLAGFCSNCPYNSDLPTSLIQSASGSLYGTTQLGGAAGLGTVFKFTQSAGFITLYSFCTGGSKQCPDGREPLGGLVRASNGNFYGTTGGGGAGNHGTIFEITPSGKLTTLYSFCSQPPCVDGSGPRSALIVGADGNLYGTTFDDGAHTNGGTIFRVTPSGALTTLYSFCAQIACQDGSGPNGLIQATDRNFYGTTSDQVVAGYGTIFKMTPGGSFTTLYRFCSQPGCPDGWEPEAALLQATDGNLYGTTFRGGNSANCPSGCGVVFRLSVGLGVLAKP